MAITLYGDLKQYNTEFHTGYVEKIAQNLDVFNAFSNGCIRLENEFVLGDYKKDAFFKLFGTIEKRDLDSNNAVTVEKIEEGENVQVKLSRRFNPTAVTIGNIKNIGMTEAEIASKVGEIYAARKMEDMVNMAILAAKSAIIGQTALFNDNSTASITMKMLNGTRRKLGDRASSVSLWVMHSTQYFDLVDDATDNYKFDNISGLVLAGATPATYGIPVLVTDSDSLINATPDPDVYYVLGLTENAVTVVEDGMNETFASDMTLGNENIGITYQGEFAYSLRVKGFAWDIANGAANPDSATVGTSTNWDLSVTSYKDAAGVALAVIDSGDVV